MGNGGWVRVVLLWAEEKGRKEGGTDGKDTPSSGKLERYAETVAASPATHATRIV